MFYGIKIMMYFDEHNPPHFHAVYNEHKALIRIEDMALMNGSLPAKALGLVIEWAVLHKDDLIDNWNKSMEGSVLSKINPL